MLKGCKIGVNLFYFFQHVKKLLNFWNFVNMKVAKHSVKPFGFLLRKLVFFDRKIRKVRNWNQNWVLIGGTHCRWRYKLNWKNRICFVIIFRKFLPILVANQSEQVPGLSTNEMAVVSVNWPGLGLPCFALHMEAQVCGNKI